MSGTCQNCGGLIAEPGKAYGYSGKFCSCLIPNDGSLMPSERLKQLGVQWNPKVTPMSILQQCEKMSLEEVKALIALLSAYYDCAMISAHPGGFKKRETNE